MTLTHLVMFGFFKGATEVGVTVITDVSSLSLVNVSGLSAGPSVGCEELDAIYVGKGKRP